MAIEHCRPGRTLMEDPSANWVGRNGRSGVPSGDASMTGRSPPLRRSPGGRPDEGTAGQERRGGPPRIPFRVGSDRHRWTVGRGFSPSGTKGVPRKTSSKRTTAAHDGLAVWSRASLPFRDKRGEDQDNFQERRPEAQAAQGLRKSRVKRSRLKGAKGRVDQ